MNKREKIYLQIIINEFWNQVDATVILKELIKLQSGKIYRGPIDVNEDTLEDIWRYERGST